MRVSIQHVYFVIVIGTLLVLGQQRSEALSCLARGTCMSLAQAADDEGPIKTRSGVVQSFMKESDGKIGIGLRHFEQMFFLYKSEPHFEEWRQVLAEALEKKQDVTCNVREYSGRIVSVER